MLLNSRPFPYINSIAHEGKLVLFGTDTGGKVWYTIKQDGFEDSYLATPADQRTGWEDWKLLAFPDDPQGDASVLARETAELTDPARSTPGRPAFLLRSVYDTKDKTAPAPVQLVSGLGYLYVFRQSKDNTLLVDRFVLDGLTNTLTRKLEVRFKRSKKRYEPSGNQKSGEGALLNIDSLDFRDINGNPFYEPTTELCLVNSLKDGWFSVVLVPTTEQDKFRWHIFAYNSGTQKVEITSLRASEEGLFEVRDYTLLDPAPRVIPGVIKRSLDLGPNAVFSRGLSATRYDLQKEKQTDVGKQLLRDSVHAMLVYGTSQGNTAAVSFSVAADGTLSQIAEQPTYETVRSATRQVLLPADSLDKIKAMAGESTPPGRVEAMRQGEDGSLVLQLNGSDPAPLEGIRTIRVSDSTDYNRVFTGVKRIDDNAFEIDLTRSELSLPAPSMGTWEVVREEETVLYDGMITAYEKTPEGKLKVTAPNHGLQTNDEVQIVDTRDYNGVYSVINKGPGTFSLVEAKWQPGGALDYRKFKGQPRRGMVFAGSGDYIQLPGMNFDFTNGISLEAWVYYDGALLDKERKILQWGNGPERDSITLGNVKVTGTDNNYSTLQFSVTRSSQNASGAWSSTPQSISASRAIVLKQWIHLAATIDATGNAALYKNGECVGTGRVHLPESITRSNNRATPYEGQMAEVRLWNTARSADEIKNNMYRPLTGQEPGLCGYWRLNGIVVEEERKAVDFSVYGNHGTVIGGAYVSGVSLKRKLESGITASKYTNEELFAVTEGATYTEEFEFKLSPARVSPAWDLTRIKTEKIFSIAWRGKSSHNAREWIEIPVTRETSFTSSGPDWFRGSATFIVPDGVSLVRVFGVEQVKGDWVEIEIRNHAITQVTDTVTKALYADSAQLALLAEPQADKQADLKTLSGYELQRGTLELDKRRLSVEIKSYEDATPLELYKAEKEAEIKRLSDEISSLQKQSIDAASSAVTVYRKKAFDGEKMPYRIGLYTRLGETWNDQIASLKVPAGLKVELYADPGFNGDKAAVSVGDYADLSSIDGKNMYQAVSSLRVMTSGGYTSSQEIQNRLSAKYAELLKCQAELSGIVQIFGNITITGNQADWNALKAQKIADAKARREAVVTSITGLDRDIDSKRVSFLNGLAAPRAMPMTTLKTYNSLETQGAALAFLNPVERLQALETCAGNVQIGYFDKQGRMRQTNYDAAADSNNASFQAWLPDAVRTCLNVSKGSDTLKLANQIELDKEWSLEAWFFYPLPANPGQEGCTLAGSFDDQQRVFIQYTGNGDQPGITAEKLGLSLSGVFFDSTFDMKSLPVGWHHLSVAAGGEGDQAYTEFHIDGRPVGEKVMKKITSNIAAIGNRQAGGQPSGKLAEVRLWNTALRGEEVFTNSKVTLTGNEPGLLACFPMTDGTGTRVADKSAYQRVATLGDGGLWWPCTAPIGNLGHQVMQFDGVDDSITLPSMDIDYSKGTTIEAWVLYRRIKPGARILEWGNGPTSHNIVFCNPDTSKTLRFMVYKDGTEKHVDAPDAILLGEWMHLAVTIEASGNTKLYRNGVELKTGPGNVPANTRRAKNFIGRSNGTGEYFDGQMAEIRVWTRVRPGSEIQADMHRRLAGGEPGLAACWHLDEIRMERSEPNTVTKTASTAAALPGTVSGAVLVDSNSLPMGGGALTSAEYSTIGLDPATNQISAMMRRFYAATDSSGVNLLAGQRLESLELMWIGNGQFAPTLLGYIEGAPPVPSENLTLEQNYNGATWVELTLTEDMTFNWRRTQDAGLGANIDVFAGVDTEADVNFVAGATKVASARGGFKGNLGFSYQFQNESSIAASSSQMLADRQELSGSPETEAHFAHLGKRFIPKNVGYALVVSALADVFIARLARTKKMLGYQVLPVEGIPPDINTITFLINPAYTMNGSLDGMTGSRATSQRFFRHVPAMRAQYGSLYPAGYYRLQEAYALKQQIEQQDKDRQSYFAQFNSLLVDETSLQREIDRGDVPAEIGVQREEDAGGSSAGTGQDTQALVDQQSPAVQQKRAEIQAKIDDLDTRIHASACFASWQRKMEDLQIRAGKRNIVNTYVWDADGGLRSESQSFANTAEHTIGGSFMLNAALGAEMKYGAAGVQVELTAQATINMTQTMSKTEARSRGIALNVDLSGVESRGVTDYNDYPLLPGEKVNRYRFMSFYLEGSTNHFKDFFQYVVDPEWLAGNSEEARALRHARGKPNKAWRVLHRITYVERPALMGFGALRVEQATTDIDTRLGNVQAIVKTLQQENKEIREKLDQILQKLNNP